MSQSCLFDAMSSIRPINRANTFLPLASMSECVLSLDHLAHIFAYHRKYTKQCTRISDIEGLFVLICALMSKAVSNYTRHGNDAEESTSCLSPVLY